MSTAPPAVRPQPVPRVHGSAFSNMVRSAPRNWFEFCELWWRARSTHLPRQLQTRAFPRHWCTSSQPQSPQVLQYGRSTAMNERRLETWSARHSLSRLATASHRQHPASLTEQQRGRRRQLAAGPTALDAPHGICSRSASCGMLWSFCGGDAGVRCLKFVWRTMVPSRPQRCGEIMLMMRPAVAMRMNGPRNKRSKCSSDCFTAASTSPRRGQEWSGNPAQLT